MKPRLLILLLLTVSLVWTTTSVGAQESSTYISSECDFATPIGLHIQCGYLTVPEDHDQPDGATIRIAVAILKSSSDVPHTDPLVYLQGGPGGSSIQLELLTAMTRVFTVVLRERDIVLFDQRGTGLSEPNLSCPEMVSVLTESTTPVLGGSFSDEMLAALYACRDRLKNEGVNLSNYTTHQSAADLAMLREAMGYEQINLLGSSYGTRLALEIMRDYPEGIRSVILDSVLIPNVDMRAEESANTAHAFDQVFERCQSDVLCRLTYSDLKIRFYDLIDQLNREPLQISTLHPRTDQPVEVTVTGDQLAEVLSGMLYSAEGVARIPSLVSEIQAGEYDQIERMIFPQFDPRLAALSSPAMQYSVICNDMLPFVSSPEQAPASDAQSVFTRIGLFGNGQLSTICAEWDTSGVRSGSNQPVVSDIPTLILEGQYDHITPVSWGEKAAETLSHSFVVVFSNLFHSLKVTGGNCLADISRDFLNNPDIAPQAPCVGDFNPTSFAVTAAATRPLIQFSALLLGGVVLWGAGTMSMASGRRRPQLAWKMSLRTIGWIGIVSSIVGIVFLMLGQDDQKNPFSIANAVRAVEAVVPLVIGVQAAFALSPEDEPGIETLLACPRPIWWMLLERLLIILLIQTGIALVGTVVTLAISGEKDILIAFGRWIAPSLFFCGVGAFTTIRSRQPAFSVAITGVLWFIFSFMGALLLPGQPTFWPLSILQPYLWPLHAFLQPGDMRLQDYWLNRAVVSLAGIALVVMALRQLRDEERVLLGVMKSKRWLRSEA